MSPGPPVFLRPRWVTIEDPRKNGCPEYSAIALRHTDRPIASSLRTFLGRCLPNDF
jgi:hypothetical protein